MITISPNCPLCPRLAEFREENRKLYPDWYNAPVPSFGSLNARLLIVGLAPGLKGANRTGRPFTGDYAGDLLYKTLLDFGWAKGQYERSPDDGLQLIDCRITNTAHCVPPQNKPLPTEIKNCNIFLKQEIAAMPNLRAIISLGRIAHDAILMALDLRKSKFPFGHGAKHNLQDYGLSLYDSYHCSRYNTQTNRLTEAMFIDIFKAIRQSLSANQ